MGEQLAQVNSVKRSSQFWIPWNESGGMLEQRLNGYRVQVRSHAGRMLQGPRHRTQHSFSLAATIQRQRGGCSYQRIWQLRH